MPTEQSILERLEALEKQNRFMKRLGVAVIVIAASLLVMGQTPAVNRTVEGNEFILRDGNGTVRSKWSMADNGPRLSFFDTKGAERIRVSCISANADVYTSIDLLGPSGPDHLLHLYGPDHLGGPGLQIYDQDGGKIGLSSSSGLPGLLFIGKSGSINLEMSSGNPNLLLNGKTSAATMDDTGISIKNSQNHIFGIDDVGMFIRNGQNLVSLDASNNPSIEITDKDGYKATLGTANLIMEQTGETHRTSAASLILFGKDKKVLWKAPPDK